MALSGIQIFKFLPAAKKTADANCKKCGCPTCMAYAMKLAKGEISVELCPFIDDVLRQEFLQANKKPQIKVEVGKSSKELVIGEENVMFRHEKTFVNPCGIAVKVNTEEDLKKALNYKIERVGEEFRIDAVFIENTKLAEIAFENDLPVILSAKNYDELEQIKGLVIENKPLIYLTSQRDEDIVKAGQLTSVVIEADNINRLADISQNILNKGVKNAVLNLKTEISSQILAPLTEIRLKAVKEKFEPFSFPVMKILNLTGNASVDAVRFSALICKYVNLIILDRFDEALISAGMTLRQNIYTDPQKPLQVEPKLYEIGEVDENSQVMVTTNFALTYFAVVNELEAMDKGSYLVITDSDGMSVLTAWSASKFTGEIIAKAVKKSAVLDKVNHNKLVIPGLAGELLEEVQQELPEWKVVTGPNEATDLPEFLNTLRVL